MSAETSAAFVLYVEDEVLIQQLVEITLQDAGYAVLLASNGREGMAALSDRTDEIIGLITDITLGDSTGWEVARHARELNPDLPVIYVSGRDGHEWAAQGVPQSVMISKPFAPMQIVVAISSLLNAVDP